MQKIYKRGQVEWAIWRHMAEDQNAPERPPKKFLTRIKRLLEIDREPNNGFPGPAFCESGSIGTGKDLEFTVFDAFCLCIGLDLINVGFKQREVVFLLSHTRPELKKEFDFINSGPGLHRARLGADDYPELPKIVREKFVYADPTVIVLFERIETTEVISPPQKEDNNPVYFAPKFFHGIEAFKDGVKEIGLWFRVAAILELASSVTAMRDLLPKAPELKRGRP